MWLQRKPISPFVALPNSIVQSDGERLICQNTQDLQQEDLEQYPEKRGESIWRRTRLWGSFVTLLLCLSLLLLILPRGSPRDVLAFLYGSGTNITTCTEPAVRKEWRQLSIPEQQQYIGAVRCLHAVPSRMRPNGPGSLNDEFAWVHRHTGNYAHSAAPFLPWHRYFLHVYEKALRESCGYTGHLTYWDWTLDWEDPAGSVIWDNLNGFGGNGATTRNDNVTAEETVGDGHCVSDGPFAGLRLRYLSDDVLSHCLSRDFRSDNGSSHFSGYNFRPEAMSEVFRQRDFNSFLMTLENGPHDAIPLGVRGDFFFFTAPNEPVFILHHANLDRIWWQWQSGDPSRVMEYHGPISRYAPGNETAAALNDSLKLHGLAKEISVADIMSTESNILCYKYQI